MSFSSAEWTIPELCVWIATKSRSAVNGLSSSVRDSLKYSDMLHSGAYAARDEVIEAAQQGRITVSCAGERTPYRSNPERMKLSRDFWNNAELVDAGSWMAPGSRWCVARRIGQPVAKDYRDLLVDSSKAKELWQPPEAHSKSGTVPGGGGSIFPTRVADTDPSPPPSDDEVAERFKAWAKHENEDGRPVTEGAAMRALGSILGVEAGRNETRRMLDTLPREWRAERGETLKHNRRE